MAATSKLNHLTDGLIAAVTKSGKDNPRFRALKRRVDDTLKSPLYGRTDQFAVANQLDGLEEKFRVLSRDDLADALRLRLTELDEHRGSLFPEILSLLLHLADRPAQLSRVDRIEKPRAEEDRQQLSWTDLDASGTAYCDEDIWENVDYCAGSSDEDDISSLSDSSQRARSFTRTSIAREDDYVIPDDVFSSGEDEELVESIESAQFWRDGNSSDMPQSKQAFSRVVTELQLVREVIFMLQGLPTSLFWRLDGQFELDRRYTLSHLSPAALSSLLRSVSSCGSKIYFLRRFAATPQTTAYMQTFHRCIENHLSKFDKFLSDMQFEYLSQRSLAVSLLQLSDGVQSESRLLILLADLVSTLECESTDNTVRCLDLLYDLVCSTQAAGDDENFTLLARIFFDCFETYARPIRRWMETGQLEPSAHAFFVRENHERTDLRTLWHDWYTLDKQPEFANVPKFIRPFADRIFIAGKSMVFLKRLNMVADSERLGKVALSFEDVYPSDPSLSCLPFHALLEAALSKEVNEQHASTSSLLRTELDEQCGLWISLEVLEHIYLCRDMSMIGPIDAKIFELIDRGKGGWSDRFLLTELAQSAFSTMPLIDPTRLIVRSAKDTDSTHRTRSVKLLRTLSFDYILPWPVTNIITRNGIAAYQRISTFFMQIRRAKYTIIKQRLQYSHADTGKESSDTDTRSKALIYALRHNMLWFLNTLYSHLTAFVVSSTTESFRKSLSTAGDVDAMIAAHRSYMDSLEEQCLLSTNLHPLHQATLTVLDLCISFADLQSSRSHQNIFDPTRTPRKQTLTPAKPFRTGMTPTPRKTRYEYSYGDEEDTDTDEDAESDSDSDNDDKKPHNRRRASLQDTHYIQRLQDIQNQFNRLISFMAAGLKGVGRVDGQVSWEMLAEKLEWRKAKQVVWS
ncbi:putative gamma-tubulin complex component GCP5 [Aspergillus lucknowensis]|uniref:Spindle pole body component n=1 Tax=Aspergillus lucknowensis TaxID=176173 RepID=A0ABR4LFH2_9EURO